MYADNSSSVSPMRRMEDSSGELEVTVIDAIKGSGEYVEVVLGGNWLEIDVYYEEQINE